ncbi:MAG TPA: non-homologous end-joining DNA ligase [Solirubrobacterales bacterium]|nr:non-homologous end-joining DNA ligase [Solirubrobacterales bacterium]
MLATSGDLPLGSDWTYEIKWDGIRVVAYVVPGAIQLVTRNGIDVTRRYPELKALPEAFGADDLPAILDGEIVAMDETGHPDFSRLQRRMNLASDSAIAARSVEIPAYFAIFDLLAHRGDPTIDRAYAERRALLESLRLHDRSWSVPRTFSDGQKLLTESTARGMEGVVAKKLAGIYRPGLRTTDWIKTKNRPRQEFVIGGRTPGLGARSHSFGSLLVGAHRNAGEAPLHYFGNVGSGFNDQQLGDLTERLTALERADSPFRGELDPRVRGARFVEPRLIAEIEYQELTGEGRLRQPVFKGLREDKDASDVVFEGNWPAGAGDPTDKEA